MKASIRRVLLAVCLLTTTMVLMITMEYVNAEFRLQSGAKNYENMVLDQVAAGYKGTDVAF